MQRTAYLSKMPLSLLALAVSLTGCIPLGTELVRTKVVWEDAGARIERRSFMDSAFVPVSADGPGTMRFNRAEYWLIDVTGPIRLGHVREAHGLTADNFPDRYYLQEIFGDQTLDRWFLIAYHITGRERANIYLTLFDRERIIKVIEIPNCHRDYSKTLIHSPPAHYSLSYDKTLKAMRYVNDQGSGMIELNQQPDQQPPLF